MKGMLYKRQTYSKEVKIAFYDLKVIFCHVMQSHGLVL